MPCWCWTYPMGGLSIDCCKGTYHGETQTLDVKRYTHKQSLFSPHNVCKAVLLLNISDGSDVNWLPLTSLLRWNQYITCEIKHTITACHSQSLQCFVGTEYIWWERCQLVVIKVPLRRNKIIGCTIAHTSQTHSFFYHSQYLQCRVGVKYTRW